MIRLKLPQLRRRPISATCVPVTCVYVTCNGVQEVCATCQSGIPNQNNPLRRLDVWFFQCFLSGTGNSPTPVLIDSSLSKCPIYSYRRIFWSAGWAAWIAGQLVRGCVRDGSLQLPLFLLHGERKSSFQMCRRDSRYSSVVCRRWTIYVEPLWTAERLH